VIVGMRYFFSLLISDARNSGNPGLALRWFGWVGAGGSWRMREFISCSFPPREFANSVWVRTIGIGAIVIAASWLVLALNGGCKHL